MGIQDFLAVFDHLDVARKGFVTVDQLVSLLQSVYLAPVNCCHVDAAVSQVCGQGHDGKVNRHAFLTVLEEISRRQSLEEQAYWDFQALDSDGSHRIKLKDALTLFQEYHGDAFSLYTWHAFLQSRLDPSGDVYFDEIRDWLCGLPSGQPASDREVREELSRIERSHWDHFRRDYDALKSLKEGDGDDEDQHSDDTRRHAHRKLQKWNHHGVGAMLLDDGLDDEGEDSVKTSRRRDAVSAADLLDAMETKYSLLTEALVAHMAAFAANMDSEKPELTQQIRRSLNKMAKDGKAGNNMDLVPGSSAMLPFTLQGMIGPLPPDHQRLQVEAESLRQRLAAEGRPASEIDDILKRESDSRMDGPLDCGQAFSDLLQRKAAERDWLMAVSRGGQEDGSSAPWQELCRLQRQLVILRGLHPVFPVAVAVGLAERLQKYQHHAYDADRERSEHLARERLQEREGHALTRTTPQLPDIAQLQGSGSVNICSVIVEEAELRYHLEREALVFMLQGPGSEQRKAAGMKTTGEERRKRLTTLRSHHLNWKTGNSGDSAQNFTILEEAVGLYWADRRSQLEERQHNVNDAAVNAAVLADLQQRQEVDFAQCLANMAGKQRGGGGRREDLIALLKQESRVRFQEHFSNVAFVVLGAVDLSKEDQEYLDVLAEKYRAIRDQIFVFALKDRHGHGGWNSLGREGRQGELLKVRKEEKKLRGDGRLEDMAAIIGPKSQTLPALVHLIGENKVYGKDFGSKPSSPTQPPVNLLADLVPRFDLEQEAILSWLHSEEAQAGGGDWPRQKLRGLAGLELERFAVGLEGDCEAALLSLGLLERVVQSAAGGRSLTDKEKQKQLAGKRVAVRKQRVRQGDPYKVPAEDKVAPSAGDRLSWHRAVLRGTQRRQLVERELLLRVLQDPGFGDLVEAAALMAVEERWQRQAQLADKYHTLNFSLPDGREENLSILEEAAALRVVGVRASVRRKMGKALSEDEVSSALMMELQDVHDAELSQWLHTGLDIGDESLLQQKLDGEKKRREEEHAGSVMTVLTRVDGDVEITDSFVKLLDEKYRALHEALMLSAVVHSGGERQSQKQRDKLLQSMRKELAPLLDAGDAEQIARVLGAALTFDPPVAWLLGMERSRFIKEREAAEKGQTISEPDKPDEAGVLAAVRHLLHRYADEKELLLSTLAGANGQFLSENMKLVLRSRLKRERSLTAAEEGIVFAALACGLAERQTESIHATRLEKDGDRYHLLGKHEFGIRQSGRDGRQKKDNLTVDKKGDRETLQDAVLSLLWKKHMEERQLLAEMLVNPRFEQTQREAALESGQQRNDRLAVLRSRRQSSNLESSSDNLALLQEALVVLREIRRGQQGQGSSTPEDDLDLNCQMMSALLRLQNTEAEQYMSDFTMEEPSELIESQEQIVEEFRKNHCVNIAAMVFSPDALGQGGEQGDPLEEALQGKYDALRDKLLIDALISQMGEKNWRNLSERERQRRLMELKLKMRQLQREGRSDEAAALLGEALNNEATLKKLMGDSRDEYERKLRERLEKRRQRMAEGMSEEECRRLEEEEEEREAEEARQRRRDVLQDLERNFDQERDALFRQLQESKDSPEKERQRRLLQLKLEQRRLRRDDDVHSTALLLHQHDR
ncbi:uncharacterized protein LOC143300038 [Babylonia areolata]|uniref:uncharacterized protein LOC143300038 n=1 Tax=Babylonia areolata TaxID=304850 RepID=UPI003FD4FD06